MEPALGSVLLVLVVVAAGVGALVSITGAEKVEERPNYSVRAYDSDNDGAPESYLVRLDRGSLVIHGERVEAPAVIVEACEGVTWVTLRTETVVVEQKRLVCSGPSGDGPGSFEGPWNGVPGKVPCSWEIAGVVCVKYLEDPTR